MKMYSNLSNCRRTAVCPGVRWGQKIRACNKATRIMDREIRIAQGRTVRSGHDKPSPRQGMTALRDLS